MENSPPPSSSPSALALVSFVAGFGSPAALLATGLAPEHRSLLVAFAVGAAFIAAGAFGRLLLLELRGARDRR